MPVDGQTETRSAAGDVDLSDDESALNGHLHRGSERATLPRMGNAPVTRREFLQTVAATAAVAPFISVPSRTAAPMLRHASIGASGQAFSDITAFAKHPAFDLVAVADVDLARFDRVQQRFPKVRVYQDWRELLEKEHANIDSVNVSTPDHMHFAIAIEALKRGKPVYVQKPLCNTLRETRTLAEYARQKRLTTQMGIQVSSTRVQRYGEALVRSGIVGKIREVHTFSNKSWGDDKPLPEANDYVPAPFDWDRWLGMSDPRPFKKGVYHPGEWRRRVGFGTGTLGDMGCHIYSPPYRALNLTSPIEVTAAGPSPSAESWATKARVKVTYPGTEFTAGKTVDVWWYDGGELPPDALREAIADRFPQQGSIVVGTDGLIVLPHVSADPFVLPESKMASLPKIEIT
ncbi:MAG TPA: Gfo/Idh/MocA family oxidoreductase, partial [Vicinamibacterales bacterium]